MLTDSERQALDLLRQARESLAVIAAYAPVVASIEDAEREVHAVAGQRDADDAVQADYLAKRLAGLEAAHLDAAQVTSVEVDDKTGEITVVVKPAPVVEEPVEEPVEAVPAEPLAP